MSNIKNVILILMALLLLTVLSGASVLTGDRSVEQAELFIQRSDAELIEVDFVFPGVEVKQVNNGEEAFDLIRMEGEGSMGTVGEPELPVITRLFAIPNGLRPTVKLVQPVYRTYQGIMPYPHQEYEYGHPSNTDDYSINEGVYNRNQMFPDKWISLGKPAIMRDFRVVPVNIHPIRVNPVTGEAEVLVSLHLEIEFDNGPTENVKTRQFDKTVPSFNSMYRELIANYDWTNTNGVEVKGSILVVYPNVSGVYNLLQPFVEWKKRIGYNTVLAQVPNNSSTSYIQSVIQQHYDTLDPPLEFVVLIGDAAGSIVIPCSYFGSGWYDGSTDHYYSQLEGGDVLADVAVGRISVGNTTDLNTAITKILYYERDPMTFHTSWYKRGMVVAGSSSSGISTIMVNKNIRHWWLEDGFTEVDTMWYTMGGSIPNFMTNTIEGEGISALNFRGYIGTSGFTQSDVFDLENPGKLPFAVILTCGTGDFGSSNAELSEAWLRAGSAANPTGGIGGIGTATSGTHTRFNNTMAAGTWFALHSEGITQLGPMIFRGKYELYTTYQYDWTQMLNFIYWNNLMADPSTDLWNDIPQMLVVEHPDEISVGTSSFTVTVEDENGNPLQDRYVCLWKGDETYVAGRTDESGIYTAAIDVPTEGELLVTVTYHNDRPYLGSANVVEMPVYPSYYGHSLDDDNMGSSSGNGDGVANPGEIVELDIQLKNFGTSNTSTGINTVLSSTDDKVSVLSSSSSYPNISAGNTAYGNSLYTVQLSGDFPDGYVIPLTLTVNSTQGQFVSAFEIPVASAELITSAEFTNGTEPGVITDVIVTLQNRGSFDLEAVSVEVTTEDQQIVIDENNATFGDISAGGMASNSTNPFVITIDEWATEGHNVNLILNITSANGFETEKVSTFMIGEYNESTPFGPDEYGYYCIDNMDVEYDNVPVYDWFEINFLGTQIPLPDYSTQQDASSRVVMPFEFSFYGESSDTLTVCSNGWLALGDQTYHLDFRNYPIPTPFGPNNGMICPYWDDIVMGSGAVYGYYDEDNHRYIVEYDNVDLASSGSQAHKFQVILYDQDYYPTPTGDGEIVFQYSYVNPTSGISSDNPYFTTGIMNHQHTDGLQYAYWNDYHPAAAVLQSGRAVKFTTVEPIRTPPSHNFEVTLEPASLPIVIPASGGTFEYYAEIANNSTSTEVVDVWIDATLPNGSVYGPILLRQGLVMTGSGSLGRDLEQNVPGVAPMGVYNYNAYAGDYRTGDIWSEDHFEFEKVGVDENGISGWDLVGWDDYLGAANVTAIPETYQLGSAAPNPFNPTTNIAYALPSATNISLVVYNTMGQRVAILEDGWREAGWHSVCFDASMLSSGLYFYTLKAGDFVQTEKMLLIK